MANNDVSWTNCQSDNEDEGGIVSAEEQVTTAIVEAMMQRPQLAELLSLARKTYSRLGTLRGEQNTNDFGARKKAAEDGSPRIDHCSVNAGKGFEGNDPNLQNRQTGGRK